MKRFTRCLPSACLLHLLLTTAQGADPRFWQFPIHELTKQNIEQSIGEGADDLWVWSCKPGMGGATSVSASTGTALAPAGDYVLTLRVKPLDNRLPKPVLKLLVSEDGVGRLADVTLFASDFARSGQFVDWQLPLAKSLDDSRLTWVLQYLGNAAILVDELKIAHVYHQADRWPEVEILRLGPAGLISATSDSAAVQVVVKNQTFDRQSVVLTVNARQGVDDVLFSERRTLDLDPLQSVDLLLPGKQPSGQGGIGLHGEISRNGELLNQRDDIFAVADNFNQVSQLGAAGLDVNSQQAPGMAAGYRTAGIGALEVNFWAPCDFSCLAPTVEEWISGQGLRRVRKADLQQAIAAFRRQGLRVLTYGDMWLCGTTGLEWARRHPEQTIWEHLYYGGEFDIRRLDALRANDLKLARSFPGWDALTPRLTDPDVQHLEAEQILASIRMFGWDGIRYDNGGLSVMAGKDLLGHERPTVPADDSSRASAEMITRLRSAVARQYPRFVFGDNTGGRFGNRPPDAKWRAEAADGGLIMEEGVGQLSVAGNWADMARHAVLAARTARACGGYQVDIVTSLVPQLSWTARPYCYILEMAGGAHVAYVDPAHAMRPYCRFALRWGELLYDLSARALQGADNPFQTDAAVWWQDYVTCRDLPDQRRQYIVSLVQPPAAKHVNECFPPLETLANLVLNFQPPPGQRATGAWALEPEPQPRAVRVPLAGEGPIRLVVPRLKYWTVVVVETTAGAGPQQAQPTGAPVSGQRAEAHP